MMKGTDVQSALQLPSRLLFIRSYLREYRRGKEVSEATSHEEELALLKEVQAFTLVTHFFWGLWSAVNARISSIPFGYWECAIERLDSYFKWKNLLNARSSSIDPPVKRKIDDIEG